ncbi:4-alpha-glucanotransferase [Gryllotalpicola protaetiae]|uniref:4-alpha-glucanotransferase n=1 Tax=Gryllotalpicola protaetiae TaxID=2419771 RepID=A0A387BEH6_9MICO|nr:4-alpha-glucanotransferase [Gryllotalpicola protaetiae]AYG02303.1 4-alpha-glucanotransferase [Gryllotalpicola protaetiae]
MTDPNLAQLASAFGVLTEYWDWQGRHVEVADATLSAILVALGADVTDPAAALEERALAPWRRMLPPTVVTTQGVPAQVPVHVPDGAPVEAWVELEDAGGSRPLVQVDNWNEPREIDGVRVGEASFEIPADLPLGYHVLHARSGETSAAVRLAVTPAKLELPGRLGSRPGWGLAAQLYSVHSSGSWAIGDLTDLTDLSVWAATEHGADFVLVNPMHAVAPLAPMTPSPYLPVTRRFTNPMYLRPERVPEWLGLKRGVRKQFEEARDELAKVTKKSETVERDAGWDLKRAALEAVHAVTRTPGREASYRWFLAQNGRSLEDYARWCALAAEHGGDWRQWPTELQDPDSPAVAAFAAEHEWRVDFHRWLQWLTSEQLDEAQAAARRHGMALGVMHDLAVGVDSGGVDAWRLQRIYAQGFVVGAPPDAYSQTGQGWGQPPWRPDALAEAGYEPFREIVAGVLTHSGGVRMDHVAGLFRLWWVPEGEPATNGTYVRYDHEALVGILALEAHRAGAVVVGEDVGVVEPWTREYLAGRGILGTSILWFERDYGGDGRPLAPESWRELCLGSVTTHDLPPSLSYLAGDHVLLRERLGLLTRPAADELAETRAERELWLGVLRERGLLVAETEGEASDHEIVYALHRFLAQTPARLRALSLPDAVGDRRTQNQPGSVDEYPNWRVPLTDSSGKPVPLEKVFTSERAARLIAAVRGA